MRCAAVLLGLLLPLPVFAQAPQGRYQGTAFDQRPDGTRGAQIALFMIFRTEGQMVACSGGTDSFDE